MTERHDVEQSGSTAATASLTAETTIAAVSAVSAIAAPASVFTGYQRIATFAAAAALAATAALTASTTATGRQVGDRSTSSNEIITVTTAAPSQAAGSVGATGGPLAITSVSGRGVNARNQICRLPGPDQTTAGAALTPLAQAAPAIRILCRLSAV